MKKLDSFINKIDHWQQKHRWSAFSYAVIKKYSDDESGYQAALLTYYGFLSLFPLLLIISTIASQLASSHPSLQHGIIQSVSTYFPVLGNQLSEHVGTLHKNGLALIIGILFLIYGARGVADAFRRSVQQIWRVPKAQRPKFPKTILNSLIIIVASGVGLIAASIFTGLAASAGHGPAFRVFSLAVNLYILFWLFIFLLNVCLPKHVRVKDTVPGALTAALGIIILQILGGVLLKNELQRLDALYSYFAVALGLLFWIYLQAQLIHYAVTISAVSAQHLWPRKINEK
ncbi:MAG TPA: YihY/virulence factor BrkB family protein [Candidatus Saccharimonadales bacterium]|nr:YihY/virulence factor BrkB family protein [Candidatus Saccharimonadales bacterium]